VGFHNKISNNYIFAAEMLDKKISKIVYRNQRKQQLAMLV